MYTEIIDFFDQRRLKEGFTQLKAFAEQAGNWNILANVDELQTNYEYMLKYALLGHEDPERETLFYILLQKGYELADEIKYDQDMMKGNGTLCDKYRTEKLKPSKTYTELQEELYHLNLSEGYDFFDENQECLNHELFNAHTKFMDELFTKTIISTHWSESEYDSAFHILCKGMSVFDIEVWVSAITLSLLNYFDIRKFEMLLNIYLDKPYPEIQSRTLIGIALTIYYHENRMEIYNDEIVVLKYILSLPEIKQELHLIQQLFLLSRETEKIDKKMREEIIPQMLKNPYLKHQDKKFEDIELSELEEDNPEWEKDMNKITEQIHELGELQREGADTYMSTFAMLKHYSFFNETAHWFYPFNKGITTIANIFKEKDIQEKSILNAMLKSPAFCDSDKYSFCLALNEIPLQQMHMMGESMEGKEEFLNEQLGAPRNLSEEENHKIIYRQYIHDLYRFFKLWNFRKQQHDIFTDKLDLWNTKFLRDHIARGEKGKEIATYLLIKGYYSEASDLYHYLLQDFPTNTDMLQKLGFAYQKQKDFDQAIQYYNLCLMFNNQDVWTLKHLAHCHKKVHDNKSALIFFQKAEKIDPENLNITLQIGQCLASLNRFEEALKCFFKVEYLGKAPENARRAIAWCYFMTEKYEDAARFYERIINESEPNLNDWLNLGHVYLAQGDIKRAVSYYKKAASACDTHDDFVKIYSNDIEALTKAGVSQATIYVVLDLV